MNLNYRTLFFVGVFAVAIIGTAIFSYPKFIEKNEIIYEAEKATLPPDLFQKINIEAKAALVFDMKEGRVLYEKNADVPLPLASLTKVMTATLARESLKEEDIVFAPKSVVRGENGEIVRWNVKELLKVLLVESSNEAAAILSQKIAINENDDADPIAKMNALAKKIGMSQTFFINSTGLDSTSYVAGGYGTLVDYTKLFSYTLYNYPGLFESTQVSTSTASSFDKKYFLSNTNLLANSLPGLVASKTGFTDLAGGNLLIVIDVGPNHPIFIGVMGSSKDGRFSDVEVLTQKTLETLALQEN